MTPRELQEKKIRCVKAQLGKCKKGTPHYKDLDRHLKRLQKELIIYDVLHKGVENRGKNASEIR